MEGRNVTGEANTPGVIGAGSVDLNTRLSKEIGHLSETIHMSSKNKQ